ncbi:hypothetical protein ACOSQ4_003939 [Xanthoceras sorbifolium]
MEDPQGRAVTGYPLHVPTAYSKPTAATAAPGPAATASNPTATSKDMDIIIIIFCAIMLVLSFGSIFIVLSYYPRPTFKSLEFEIHSLSVRPINISSSHITGEWGVEVVAVINPNNETHYVQDIEAEIFYKQCLVTSKRMEPICNDGNEKQFWMENFDISSESIGRLCTNSIETDWLLRGKTNFTLILRSVVKDIIDSSPSRKITAKCNEIEVEFSSNLLIGSMVGDLRDCDVNSQTL